MEVGKSDTKYQRMIFHTEEETPNKYIEKDSELFKNGSERKHLEIFTCKNGNKLLVRNSEEVIIPERSFKRASLHTSLIGGNETPGQGKVPLEWYG